MFIEITVSDQDRSDKIVVSVDQLYLYYSCYGPQIVIGRDSATHKLSEDEYNRIREILLRIP